MNIEISTNHEIHLPAEQAVLRCYRLGFNHIQLGTPHFKANFQLLNKLREKLNLKYSMHAPFLAPKPFIASAGAVDKNLLKKSREIFLKTIENAAKVKAHKVVVHTAEPGLHSCLENTIATMRLLCRKAKRHGIIICVENKIKWTSEIGFLEEDMKRIAREVKEKNLKFCFDTGHAIATYGSPKKALKFFDDVARHIGDVHLVPGTGEWDVHTAPISDPHFYRQIVSRPFSLNYGGDLTFECAPEIPESEIIRGAEYVRGTIAEIFQQRFVDKRELK
ncbi:MAG: sugar phosphate isomerase/epimerase family protein [Candidatus Woesearchaeota archaeon]